MLLRSGEQNLHRDSAPPSASGDLFRGAICSPLPAKPCCFVPGSKIFTEIPRRRMPLTGIFAARFAPRPPQSLAASFRGAKSSQKFRAAICLRRPFPWRDLLPAPSKALRLRSGEQNLHRSSAPPSASGGFFSGAICSPPPAKPCGFVPGSKIFTEIPRRHLPPATFSAARFAPRPPQSLAASFGEQNLHRNSAPVRATGDSCWRCPAGKRLYHRRATPTGRPKSRPAADHVGAVPPANAYITVGPRQQGAPNPARRPTMLALSRRQTLISPSGHANRAPKIPPGGRLLLALSRRQTLISPSGHANRAPKIPPGGRPCWRCPAGKRLYHRRATPTGRPESRPAADPVGAAPPAKP